MPIPSGIVQCQCAPHNTSQGLLPKRALLSSLVFPVPLVVAILILGLVPVGCRPTLTADPVATVEEGPDWFEDITDAVGLDFVHDPGLVGSFFMPQSMGSGAAVIHEFGPDGRETLYLYLLQNAGPDSKSVNRLYQQLPDGTFRDVTKGSGLDVAGFNMGVAVADVNNDGLPDVLLTQYGGIKLILSK